MQETGRPRNRMEEGSEALDGEFPRRESSCDVFSREVSYVEQCLSQRVITCVVLYHVAMNIVVPESLRL